jgi:hypothetical protein
VTAKNIKKKSIPRDAYMTPQWCVDQCVDLVLPWACPSPVSILEPSAGKGVFVETLRKKFSTAFIQAIDINQKFVPWKDADVSTGGDYLNMHSHDEFDLIIGNPPYTYAMEFVQKSIETAQHVVFLLRQGFLSSGKRSRFFIEHPPSWVFLLANRPSFTGDNQTDTADYCWVVWSKKPRPETKLRWLPEVPAECRRIKSKGRRSPVR